MGRRGRRRHGVGGGRHAGGGRSRRGWCWRRGERDVECPARFDQVGVGVSVAGGLGAAVVGGEARDPVVAVAGDALFDVVEVVARLDRDGDLAPGAGGRCVGVGQAASGGIGGQGQHGADGDLIVRADHRRVEPHDLGVAQRVVQVAFGDSPQGVSPLHPVGRRGRRGARSGVSSARTAPVADAPGVTVAGGRGCAAAADDGNAAGDDDVEVVGSGGGAVVACAALARPPIMGATVNPTTIAATRALAGSWNAPSPGRDRAGFPRATAASSGTSETTNSAQQIHTPTASTSAASRPLSRCCSAVPIWCRDGRLRGAMFSCAIRSGTPTTMATRTSSAPTARRSGPSRLVGVTVRAGRVRDVVTARPVRSSRRPAAGRCGCGSARPRRPGSGCPATPLPAPGRSRGR